MINVYLDLDGVVADFDGRVKELFGKSMSEFPSSEIWGKIGQVEHFYLSLDPLPKYKTLFDHLMNLHEAGTIHLEVLTSLPLPTNNLITAADDKIAWSASYLCPSIKVNTVIGGQFKAKFVKQPNDVLIDDTLRNIVEWRKSNGVGIHHISNAETIIELSTLLDNQYE